MSSESNGAMARKLEELEVGTLRHKALVTVQKFKTSWVELGALLVEVRRSGNFSEWGFASFEEYCSRELRLKRQTADKLTASYSFLARHERQALESRAAPAQDFAEPPARIPPFEVISVLAGAEERGQLGGDDYQELRKTLWEEESSPTKLARELTQRYPPPPREAPPIDLQLRRFAAAARKFAKELEGCGQVPRTVVERAQALAEDLAEIGAGGGGDEAR